MTPARRGLFLGAGLAAAVLAAFWPVLGNGFVNWDDPGNIVRNPLLGRLDPAFWRWAFTTTHYGHFQPLAWLSLSVDKALWGAGASGFHLTALALHAASCVAAFSVVRLLLARISRADERARDLAAAAAVLLWAVHPMRVEAVAWATERRELSSTLFSLLAVRSYLKDDFRFSLLFFVGAALSKVTSAAVPACIAVLEWILHGRAVRWRNLAPFFFIAAVSLLLGFRAQFASGTAVPLSSFGVLDRLAQAFFGPGYYAVHTVWPFGLSPFVFVNWRESPRLFWPYALATIALLLVGLWAARRRDGAMAALVCLFVLLAPSLGFFKSGPQTAADRFAHAPSLVLTAALAWALCALSKPRLRPALAVSLLSAVVFAAESRAQCLIWRDSVVLWSRAVEVPAPSPLALQNLGAALREAGREEEAVAIFARFVAADPESPGALALRGDERYENRDYEFAAALYARALSMNPDLPAVRVNLGLALLRLGRRADALQALTDAVRQDPLSASGWHNLGVVLAAEGRRDKARASYEKALALEPARADTREALRRLSR